MAEGTEAGGDYRGYETFQRGCNMSPIELISILKLKTEINRMIINLRNGGTIKKF